MSEFNNIYFVDRNNAKMSSNGDTRIKFRAPSFVNAKIRRYKIPVEPTVNQVETANKVNDSKDYELLTKSRERALHRFSARERALKLKEAREKKLASIPAVIMSSLEPMDKVIPVNVEGENREQENVSVPPIATPGVANELSPSSKPAALEDTQFNLGGVLETVKHTAVTNDVQNAVEPTHEQETVTEGVAQIVPSEPQIEPQTTEIEQTTTPVSAEAAPVAEEEVDVTIDFASKDTEQIYNELVRARDETTAAMEKASAIAAKVEETKKEFNKKIEESDQKLQEARAEMENTKSQAEASQTRYDNKVVEFNKAATAQSRSLREQRDQALQAAKASERELEEVNRNGEDKLSKNEQQLAEYNDQIKQDQATIDEYTEKTDRLDAILKAISEPIESVGNYIPSPSVANSMTAQDSNALEFPEPAAVKKVA